MASGLVRLRSGRFDLGVAPDVGSSIAQYTFDPGGDEIHLLRPASHAALDDKVPTDTACFPLVPFSNRIAHAHLAFRGRAIDLAPNFPPEPHAIHGHGWQSPWEVADRSEGALRTVYEHEADEWPWTYRAEQTYTLSERSLTIDISVTNLASEPMPAGVGLHPYFPRTPGTRVRTSAEAVWLSDDESLPTERVEVPDEWRLENLDPNGVALDHNFSGWSHSARIEWGDRDTALVLSADEPLDHLVVFTPPGENFLCVEPVSNTLDAFNLIDRGRTDVGGTVLDPGATLSGRVTFAPETG